MARRSTQQKKIARLRRTIQKSGGALPAYIDLIDYLKTRRIASTTGEARRIILARRVRSDSHVLGITTKPVMFEGQVKMVEDVDRYVPAQHRDTIRVMPA